MRKETLLALTLLAMPAVGRAEPYTIKLKPYPDAGKSVAVKTTDKLDTALTLSDDKGKELKTEKESAVRAEEFTQKTLTADGGKPATFERVYASSTVSDGKDAAKTALDGKTVAFTVKEKGCEHDLKGKLAPEESKKLAAAHSEGLAVLTRLLPDKAVNEGDEWPLSGKQIVAGLPSVPVDADRSRGKGKLVKVTKKGEVPVGTIEVEIDLETAAGADGAGKGKFTMVAEAAIDGSSTAATLTIKGTLTLESEAKEGKETRKVKVVAGGELTTEVGEEK